MENRRRKKFKCFFGDEENYAEAKRRIELCAEKGKKTLDLFSGLDLKTIPPEISRLQNLTALSIRGYTTTKIPECIGKMERLKKLVLHLKRVTEEDEGERVLIANLPKFLCNLKNLQTLSIHGDFLSLQEWIGSFKKLVSLSIDCDAVDFIPPEIGALEKLRHLVIHGEGIVAFPKEIIECPIVSLELSCPRIVSLPENICDWKELTHLHIKGQLNSIPERIGNLGKLNYLRIDDLAAKKLPDSLGNCPLETLILNGNFESIP